MELPVSAQALLFGQAVLLALGLGIFYDILRAARRLVPGCTLLADVLFGLTLGICCSRSRPERGCSGFTSSPRSF